MRADPAFVLDISRLISRLGGGPATGIDRVEAAWLAHLQNSGRPYLLICGDRRRQLLLPPEAGLLLQNWMNGQVQDLPAPGLIDRMRGRTGLPLRARRALTAHALMTVPTDGQDGLLASKIQRCLGPDAIYLNVGHANWQPGLWAGLKGLRRVALVHDTIPLDFPQFTRKGQSERFLERFRTVLTHADQILTVSEVTRQDVLRWAASLDIPLQGAVTATPIGTALTKPDPAGLPPLLDMGRPYFLALGTIEPRKNHALLLKTWQVMARHEDPRSLPQLFIVGRRGWENHDVFKQLDALPAHSPLKEMNGLSDQQVAALMEEAHGLLMPSFAEGFGLPLTEAAARGVPVLSAPLPSAQEFLGDYARYLDADDAQAWAEAISLLSRDVPLRLAVKEVPNWADHFEMVYKSF